MANNNGLTTAQLRALTYTAGSAPYWVEQYAGDTSNWSWNKLVLFDKQGYPIQFPGIAHMSGEAGYQLSHQKTSGQNLAPITNKGRKPSKMTCKFEMSGPQQYQAWLDILSTFSLLSVNAPQGPYAINHPLAVEMGINAVIIEDIKFPDRNAKDPYSPVLTMYEYGAPQATGQQPPTVAEAGIDLEPQQPAPGSIGGAAGPANSS